MTRIVRSFSTRCLVAASLLALLGCGHPGEKSRGETPAAEIGKAYPGYYWQQPGNRGVIVFMHGVLGAAEDTWKNAQTGAFWPELVKQDPEFAGFDIYLYQFPTSLFQRSLSVDELSEDLRLELQNAKVFDHREVIFVCHSMGGLITRSFLQKYQSYAAKVSFLYFFATPTEGSEIATLAQWLKQNPQFGNMLPITNTSYLADQLRAWLAAQFSIASYCAYEDGEIPGLEKRVVPMRSAAALCNRPLTPIQGSHSDVVKPKNRNDKPHRALQNALRETRPVSTVDIPEGWTLREVIETVVRGDASMDEPFQARYVGCGDAVLDGTRVRRGTVKAPTRERLIEQLAGRTEAAEPPQLQVTRNEERAVYEIRCVP